jgi:hypothetical protein
MTHIRKLAERTAIFLLLFLLGCNVDNSGNFSTVMPTDVDETNEVRAKIGLREIQEDWTFYGKQFNADSWKKNGAIGECKKVQRGVRGKMILWEEDYYYSGATYTDIDGTGWEFLTIHYDYRTDQLCVAYVGINTKSESLVSSLPPLLNGHAGATKDQTFAVADAILKQWGTSRLD